MTGWALDRWESTALSLRVARVAVEGTLPLLSDAWDHGVDLVYVDSTRPLGQTPAGTCFVGELRELSADLTATTCPTGPIPHPHGGVPADVTRFDLGGRYEHDPRLAPLAGQVYRRWVAAAATSPDREVCVLDEDAGLLVLADQGDTLRIELVGVDRARRGQGLGTALLRLAVERARAHSCTRLAVGGYAHNAAAMRLYESCGLHECAHRWRYHVHRPRQPSPGPAAVAGMRRAP